MQLDIVAAQGGQWGVKEGKISLFKPSLATTGIFIGYKVKDLKTKMSQSLQDGHPCQNYDTMGNSKCHYIFTIHQVKGLQQAASNWSC